MRQLKIEHSLTNRTEKSIEQYFTDVNKFDSITPEREVELSKLIQEGDQKALEELVQSNLKFVISVAKKYQNQKACHRNTSGNRRGAGVGE